jgi:hypothetical protein
MKKDIIRLIFFVLTVQASIYLSIVPDWAIGVKLIFEIITIYYSICIYKIWINLDKEKK